MDCHLRLARVALLTLCAIAPAAAGGSEGAHQTAARRAMVEQTIVARGVADSLVLEALRRVPRHRFVPRSHRHLAYTDHALPIGDGQTISQPYIVALMTELLELRPGDRVLEVGTGSGYQAAVLAEITSEVYSIEIIAELAEGAARRLAALGYDTVNVRAGDGYRGWPEAAPFDRIILTAAPVHLPIPLVDQLRVGGILVAPLGEERQVLMRYRKDATGALVEEAVTRVRFVPMTGEAEIDPNAP